MNKFRIGECCLKLTKEEIIECLDEAEGAAIHRMYTAKGVKLHMKIAKWYYNHYSDFSYVLIRVPLFIVDVIDSVQYVMEKNKKNSA